MQRFLLSRQNTQDGSWETRDQSDSRHYGHTSALVTYSLLQSGLSYQGESLSKSMEFLASLQGGDTYTLYPRLLCWSVLPTRFNSHMKKDVQHLLRGQQDGFMGIRKTAERQVDVRMLLYGVIGMQVAAQRGQMLPAQTWQEITNHLLGCQHNAGGWGLTDTRSGASSVEATIAAMTVMHICRLQLAAFPQAHAPIHASLQRAERYLSRHWSADIAAQAQDKTHSYEAALYNLYQLAMLTRYSGVQTYGGEDWFRQALQAILKLEAGKGSIRGDLVETAFALLFLSQADASVWMNHLELADNSVESAGVQSDIHQLTRSISALREYDLHWQVVRLEDPLTAWMTAPILCLSTDQPLQLTDAQQDRLKRYLDIGGLLVVYPHTPGGSHTLAQSLTQLARKLYPGLSFERMPEDHPVLSLLLQVDGMRLQQLSNGLRDLIILADGPLTPVPEPSPLDATAHRSITPTLGLWYNLYAWTTDRGVITTRSQNWIDPPASSEPDLRLTLVRASCADVFTPPPESMAWLMYAMRLRGRANIELVVEDQPLVAIGSCTRPLVHLAGTSPHTLTDAQKLAIRDYLQRGGTLLVESVGGRNAFASSIQSQLEPWLDAPALPLSSGAPLYQAQPMLQSPGLTRTPFRAFSVLHHRYPALPRLTAIEYQARPAVLFSQDDLTMGLLGIRRWGINGYRPEAADALVTQLLGWTARNVDPSQQSAMSQPPNY